MTTPDNSRTPTQPAARLADPIDQARTLIAMLSRSEQLKQLSSSDPAEDCADDRTLVLAAVGIAIAHHIARLADAIEGQNA